MKSTVAMQEIIARYLCDDMSQGSRKDWQSTPFPEEACRIVDIFIRCGWVQVSSDTSETATARELQWIRDRMAEHASGEVYGQ